jgi:hypothetical protein
MQRLRLLNNRDLQDAMSTCLDGKRSAPTSEPTLDGFTSATSNAKRPKLDDATPAQTTVQIDDVMLLADIPYAKPGVVVENSRHHGPLKIIPAAKNPVGRPRKNQLN